MSRHVWPVHRSPISAEALAQLTTAHVVGRYQRQPVTNDWHVGEVVVVDGELWWRNNAGVSWTLRADLGHGRLIGGADNPYPGQDFLIRLGWGPMATSSPR